MLGIPQQIKVVLVKMQFDLLLYHPPQKIQEK